MSIESSKSDFLSRIAPSSNVWVRRLTALAPVWTLLALGLFFSLASDSFLRPINLRNILAQISTLAIFTTGMTFILLLGEIDLSIAEIAGLSGTIATTLYANMKIEEPWPVLAAIGVATLLGFINGVASTRFRIPTLMTTLAMGLMAAGLNNYVSKGRVNNNVPPISSFLGSGKIPVPVVGDVPVLIIVAAITLLAGYLVLRYTRFGRYVYMTGASKPAARLAGVNTDMILIAGMTICGFTAGLAGIISTGRLGGSQPVSIPSYLIDTIGAVVLGGTALTGGRGGIAQTVIGLLIYGTLRNGLDSIASIDVFLKDFIRGVVLMAALVVNVLLSGRAPRDKSN
ncbi:MAG: ABC transporter permease [Anaerolineae bacterium]|nr:ABC transporter permease [Anaerolineae bacterium]